MNEVEFFKKRELQKFYITLTVLDVPSYVMKGGIKTKETLYVFIGLDLYGRRELAFITYEKEKDTRFWYEKFELLKERGLSGVLYASMPSNTPLKRALKASFEGITIIKSIEYIC